MHTITSLITPSPSRIRVRVHGHVSTSIPVTLTVVLFGATGDLSRRKLLCGLGYLVASVDLNADMQVVGTGLDDMSEDEFRSSRDARSRLSAPGN